MKETVWYGADRDADGSPCIPPGARLPPADGARLVDRSPGAHVSPRELLLESFHAAVAVADPLQIVPGHLPRPPRGRTVVVGAVYTPFLRVAFLSHAATERGERLEPADVDPVLTEPLAYIAFRWYGSFDEVDPDRAAEFAAMRPRVTMLQAPAPSVERPVASFRMIRSGVPPVWSKPASGLLETFGATLPYDDVVFVAAYPLENLTSLRRFVIYKALYTEEDVPQYISERWGVVRAAEAARWR